MHCLRWFPLWRMRWATLVRCCGSHGRVLSPVITLSPLVCMATHVRRMEHADLAMLAADTSAASAAEARRRVLQQTPQGADAKVFQMGKRSALRRLGWEGDVSPSEVSREDLEEIGLSDGVMCPITCDVMRQPMLLAGDGQSYERTAIAAWLKQCKKSPHTNERLRDCTLLPNHTLRSVIHNTLLSALGVDLDEAPPPEDIDMDCGTLADYESFLHLQSTLFESGLYDLRRTIPWHPSALEAAKRGPENFVAFINSTWEATRPWDSSRDGEGHLVLSQRPDPPHDVQVFIREALFFQVPPGDVRSVIMATCMSVARGRPYPEVTELLKNCDEEQHPMLRAAAIAKLMGPPCPPDQLPWRSQQQQPRSGLFPGAPSANQAPPPPPASPALPPMATAPAPAPAPAPGQRAPRVATVVNGRVARVEPVVRVPSEVRPAHEPVHEPTSDYNDRESPLPVPRTLAMHAAHVEDEEDVEGQERQTSLHRLSIRLGELDEMESENSSEGSSWNPDMATSSGSSRESTSESTSEDLSDGGSETSLSRSLSSDGFSSGSFSPVVTVSVASDRPGGVMHNLGHGVECDARLLAGPTDVSSPEGNVFMTAVDGTRLGLPVWCRSESRDGFGATLSALLRDRRTWEGRRMSKEDTFRALCLNHGDTAMGTTHALAMLDIVANQLWC